MTVGHLDWPQLSGKELQWGVKTVASTNTPEAMTSTTKRVRKVTLYGCKALARTPNATSVFIGNADSQVQQLVPFDGTLAGGEVVIQGGGPDEYIDLSEIYIDVGTNGDGVVYSYLE